MRRALARIVHALLACIVASGAGTAQEFVRDGFNFSLSNTVYRSVGDGVAGPNYVWDFGVGYGFGSQVSVGIRTLYGNMVIPTAPTRPVVGAGDLGGVGAEARLLLSSHARFTAFIAAGYDLVTILHTRID